MEVQSETLAAKDLDPNSQTEVTLPSSGIRYTDLRLGGGISPPRGYLVVIDYVGKADGKVFEDTKARGRPVVFNFGGSDGLDEVLSTMKAGGRRRVVIPAGAVASSLRSGAGKYLRPSDDFAPGVELEYDLVLVRVSIPPS